ncbi:MAG: carboxylating nicotinate-nucleotide diphosphorylase [Chloroflexi bacterium]|nr:MAG: carboxylating nicotinate-nucleotide diphosphorylase [Chloroflexota bacterium]
MVVLHRDLVRHIVEAALLEDRATDDLTTAALVPPHQRGRAEFIAEAKGILAGIDVAREAFAVIDPSLRWQSEISDGGRISPGDRIATVEGSLASILRGERVALNFLSHLSGIATATDTVVRSLEGTGCRLRDTRKTTPGLRVLEKYAVRCGGGVNHRLDLADGVLIKDNHLAALRMRGLGISDAIRLARGGAPGMRIEIEVTTLDEAGEALDAGADELLLDNMTPDAMRQVVALAGERDPRPVLEASGGITLANAREVAETGVDYISMGAITHSAAALDMSLEVEAG